MPRWFGRGGGGGGRVPLLQFREYVARVLEGVGLVGVAEERA